MSSVYLSPHDYTKRLTKSLNDQRKENQLCDVVINVGGKAFHAHKNVLAAGSSYFLAMFTSGFREAAESEVNIAGKAEIFEFILDFVYTGVMKISPETVLELLEMACYMQLIDASQYIRNYIQREYTMSYGHHRRNEPDPKIPVGDVYKIYEIARSHDHLKSLANDSEKHMCIHYKKLKSSDVFLQLASVDFLKKLLTRWDLSTKTEEKEVGKPSCYLLV